jgi:hypothetical protein
VDNPTTGGWLTALSADTAGGIVCVIDSTAGKPVGRVMQSGDEADIASSRDRYIRAGIAEDELLSRKAHDE